MTRTIEGRSKAALVLEDGSIFFGVGFGFNRKVSGEVVFSTSMMGYTEALTDPSYHRQILTLTYPLVGNYGVPTFQGEYGVSPYFESERIKVSGLVIHELCEEPSHWTSKMNLHQWLESQSIPGILGIDTRSLTKKLRTRGVMLGVLQVAESGEDIDAETLRKEALKVSDPNERDLVEEVTVRDPIRYPGKAARVVLIDCGVKHGILRSLMRRNLEVIRVPYDFSAGEIMEYSPSAVFISNGPGDPKKCAKTIETVGQLVHTHVPIMGICLGSQILALAMGGDTYKLKYGHRSQNQPALDLETQRCYITTQNHGYAVHAESLAETGLRVWFINANDRTVEGIKHECKPAWAVQFHPEASPGPYDTEFLFDQFLRIRRI